MTDADLVIQDFADENVELRERVALTDSYRLALQLAIAKLAAQNAELEAARRRISQLVGEVRQLRGAVAA